MELSPTKLWAREPVAIDLGTARTRIQFPQRGLSVERLSVLASDGRGGPYLAGRDAWAWQAGLRYAPDAPLRLTWPLHAGMVTNTSACGRLVRLLLERAGRTPGRRAPVLLGVPIGASHRDRDAAVAAVAEATRGRVTTVEEPLAAAIGAGLDVYAPTPRLLIDIGAGVTEVAVVGAGRMLESRSLPRGANDFAPSLGTPARTLAEPPLPRSGADTLSRLVAEVRDALGALSPRQRTNVVGRGLVLSGGGALVPGLAARLSGALGAAVTGFDSSACHDRRARSRPGYSPDVRLGSLFASFMPSLM